MVSAPVLSEYRASAVDTGELSHSFGNTAKFGHILSYRLVIDMNMDSFIVILFTSMVLPILSRPTLVNNLAKINAKSINNNMLELKHTSNPDQVLCHTQINIHIGRIRSTHYI